MADVLGITSYSDIGQRTTAYAEREMLKNVDYPQVISKFGLTKPLPTGTADTVKFRRRKLFTPSTVPLQEGVSPSAHKMQFEDVSCQLHQYGFICEITDWVMDTSEDPVLNSAVIEVGKWAGGTLEQIVYAAVKGGTNVVYANGASRAAVNTPVSLAKLRACDRTLQNQKAEMITQIIASTPSYKTIPVEAAYVAICHVNCASDIRNLNGFTKVAEYGSMRTIHPRELGAVENFRFITSPDLAPFTDAGGAKAGSGTTMVSTSGTSADVYPILILGQDSFAQVPLKGKNSMSPTVVNPKPSISDVLAQRGAVGCKFATAAVILNEVWQIRFEVAATAL